MRLSGGSWSLLLSAGILSGLVCLCCDDAGVTTAPDYYISGTVSNWAYGHRTLEARFFGQSRVPYTIASATIDPQGKFNLKLPSTIADAELLPADSIFVPECTGGIAFAPPSIRGGILIELQVKDGTIPTGTLQKNNYDSLYPGAYSVFWIYFKTQATFFGYKVCGSDSLNFNGTAGAGWNKIIRTCTRIDSSATYQFSTDEEPGDAIWKFQSY